MTDFSGLTIGLMGVLAVWLMVLTFVFWRIWSHYRRLVKGVSTGNLQVVLEKVLERLELNAANFNGLRKELEKMRLDNFDHLQKVGFMRFNPYPETGGNQSFSLAFLDGKDNGVVISSLHSRESTRLYAKKIMAGKPKDYDLSAEERQVLRQINKGKA